MKVRNVPLHSCQKRKDLAKFFKYTKLKIAYKMKNSKRIQGRRIKVEEINFQTAE
jgi:hypothetical protein